MSSRARLAAFAAAALTLSLASCAADDGAAADSADGTLTVLASFYPLQFITERVGGDAVSVTSLTPQGAEPHDLELSPAAVSKMSDADLVVYLSGFQPSVDDAIAQTSVRAVDTAPAAELHAGSGEEHEDDGEAADEEHADEEHDHGSLGPHFWLDPIRLAAAADVVADELSELAPEHAEDFAANADALRADLESLDADFTEGLADCESNVIVTAHEAFGYLAERYGLEQIGISGIDPESEPSPARLREISDIVTANDVSTIFTEVLISPKVAEVLAADLGVTTAVLDPLESLTEESTGEDYLAVMTSNLETLRTGLGCA